MIKAFILAVGGLISGSKGNRNSLAYFGDPWFARLAFQTTTMRSELFQKPFGMFGIKSFESLLRSGVSGRAMASELGARRGHQYNETSNWFSSFAHEPKQNLGILCTGLCIVFEPIASISYMEMSFCGTSGHKAVGLDSSLLLSHWGHDSMASGCFVLAPKFGGVSHKV